MVKKNKYTITQFQKLTGISKETIRFYRNTGLLNMDQDPKNHYYYYSENDLISLLFLRKRRNTSIPLSAVIEEMEQVNHNQTTLEDRLQKAIEERDALDRQIEFLTNAIQYFDTISHHEFSVKEEYFSWSKYDYSIDVDDQLLKQCLEKENDYSVSLSISKEDILHQLDHPHAQIKLGFHEPLNTSLPVTVYEPGDYLSMIIATTDINQISYETLSPFVEYANAHDYTFISDTTSSLIHIQKSDTGLTYYFKIRIRIQKNGGQ